MAYNYPTCANCDSRCPGHIRAARAQVHNAIGSGLGKSRTLPLPNATGPCELWHPPDAFKVSLLEAALNHNPKPVVELLAWAKLRLTLTNTRQGFELEAK